MSNLSLWICSLRNYSHHHFCHQQYGFCFVSTTSTLLLFCSRVKSMAFVLFQYQQCGFCFVSTSRRGCVNLHTPGSHQSTLNNISDGVTDKARQWLGLGPIKNISFYQASSIDSSLDIASTHKKICFHLTIDTTPFSISHAASISSNAPVMEISNGTGWWHRAIEIICDGI